MLKLLGVLEHSVKNEIILKIQQYVQVRHPDPCSSNPSPPEGADGLVVLAHGMRSGLGKWLSMGFRILT